MTLFQQLKAYWSLIKSKQTFLLVITGWAGFSSAKCPIMGWETSLMLIGSLFLAISGCTVFNMVYDRDIDQKMKRTAKRPLPAGGISIANALLVASIMAALGIGWAFSYSSAYLILNVMICVGIQNTMAKASNTPVSYTHLRRRRCESGRLATR